MAKGKPLVISKQRYRHRGMMIQVCSEGGNPLETQAKNSLCYLHLMFSLQLKCNLYIFTNAPTTRLFLYHHHGSHCFLDNLVILNWAGCREGCIPKAVPIFPTLPPTKERQDGSTVTDYLVQIVTKL